jgi:serine/threonine protein kinase
MEYVNLGDLQQYLTRPLPEGEARQIISQVLEGLSCMHGLGYAHRDLKPQVGRAVMQVLRRCKIKT